MQPTTPTFPTRFLGGYVTGETTTYNSYTKRDFPTQVKTPPDECIEAAVDAFLCLMVADESAIINHEPSQSLWKELAKNQRFSTDELVKLKDALMNRVRMHCGYGFKIEADYRPVGILVDALEDIRQGSGILAIVPPKFCIWAHDYDSPGKYCIYLYGRGEKQVIGGLYTPVIRNSIHVLVDYPGYGEQWKEFTY